MLEVTQSSFQIEVLESSIVVLVDFFADWCGPCKILAPVLEELAQEYSGKVKVVSLDVDKNPDITTKYGIRGIPALVFFKGGKPVDQIVGAAPKGAIAKKMSSII